MTDFSISVPVANGWLCFCFCCFGIFMTWRLRWYGWSWWCACSEFLGYVLGILALRRVVYLLTGLCLLGANSLDCLFVLAISRRLHSLLYARIQLLLLPAAVSMECALKWLTGRCLDASWVFDERSAYGSARSATAQDKSASKTCTIS